MAGKHARKYGPSEDNISSSRTKIGKHMTDDRKKEIRAEQQEKTFGSKNPKKEEKWGESGSVGPKTKAFIKPKPDNYESNAGSGIKPKPSPMSPQDRANNPDRKPGV
jgi:hypothetical protein